ncbi:MAG: hypothetical protein AUK06_02675 [Parcubacteria group bacterium CG2_30_36_18]|nr:MAG: hypothetical protein AUK06_02675 [Parcubacteria group bacterium CG2_30_36_18]
MDKEELKKYMTFNKGKKSKIPLFASEVNGNFIIGVYQGSLSEYDILIKYRQKNKDKKWSRIKTPKHIHWAVDILIKMYSDRKQTQDFLDFLIETWNKTKPIKSKQDRKNLLSIKSLLENNSKEIDRYKKLEENGEYSIKFLILLAKLLMVQEKTNLETAYMFKKLLNTLRQGEDIFRIVSSATHSGR